MDAELYAGSYYLSGYAVECGLKAVIAKLQGRNEFPDKRLANECNAHKEVNFNILRRVFKVLDDLPEVKELLRPDYFDVRGTSDPGYKLSRQRMPVGRGKGDREWANRNFYCYRLSCSGSDLS